MYGHAAGDDALRAIIRDRYTGIEATRMMALTMLVISVGPMLAPLSGAPTVVASAAALAMASASASSMWCVASSTAWRGAGGQRPCC